MGSIMLAFKPLEIKRRNHIASISDKKMNIILYICNFILGFIFLAILIGMSIILYPSSVLTSNGLLLMLNAFVFTLMIIALAYMLVTFFDSGNVISAIGTIFSLGFSFITGVFIPQYLLDENILRLAKVIPSYYYIQNNHRITELSNFQLSDLKDIGLNLLIQFIYALVFFIITLYISKKRQSQES
jgi:ABC-2 type transport system permease protein